MTDIRELVFLVIASVCAAMTRDINDRIGDYLDQDTDQRDAGRW